MKKLSYVIPVYNSKYTLEELTDRIKKTVSGMKNDFLYEIILVNDHSRDDSLLVCRRLCRNNKNIKLVNLSKNFGQQNALMAGFKFVTGDLIICLDDDLQNPPEESVRLINKLEEKNYDVVFADYPKKKESFLRLIGSSLNDRMASSLVSKPKELNFNSYFIAKRYVIEEVIKYEHPYPYIGGLILRVTRNIGNVTVEHRARENGKSNYSISKLLGLWLNGFTGFSIKPLRFATICGLAISFASIIWALILIIRKLLIPGIQLGWTSIMSAIFLLGGLQLFCIGLIGEYIGRVLICINNSPQYVIKDTFNIEKEEEEEEQLEAQI